MASRRRRPEPRARGGDAAEQRVVDQTVRQAVLLERVKAGLSREVRKPWDDAADDILAAVASQIESAQAAGLQLTDIAARAVVERSISQVVAEIVAAAELQSRGIISDAMVRIARIEATWMAQVLEPTLPIGVSLRMPPASQIRGFVESKAWRKFGGDTQRPLVDWTKGVAKVAKADVRKVVGEALARGTPVPEVKRALQRVTEMTGRQAEAVARTGFTHASSVGRQLVAEENTDVVIGVQWVSVLDSRTTITCASLDGRVFRVDEGPRPPAHFNCRSAAVSLTRSPADILAGKTGKPTAEDLAEAVARRNGSSRASIDYTRMTASPVAASTTYGDWLRRQPAAVQDDVLGKTRGRLFRSGQVQIEQFVGSDYQPLNLRQLEKRLGIGS